MNVLLSFVIDAHVQMAMGKHIGESPYSGGLAVHDQVDDSFDRFFNRVLHANKTSYFHHADLEVTTLGKLWYRGPTEETHLESHKQTTRYLQNKAISERYSKLLGMLSQREPVEETHVEPDKQTKGNLQQESIYERCSQMLRGFWQTEPVEEIHVESPVAEVHVESAEQIGRDLQHKNISRQISRLQREVCELRGILLKQQASQERDRREVMTLQNEFSKLCSSVARLKKAADAVGVFAEHYMARLLSTDINVDLSSSLPSANMPAMKALTQVSASLDNALTRGWASLSECYESGIISEALSPTEAKGSAFQRLEYVGDRALESLLARRCYDWNMSEAQMNMFRERASTNENFEAAFRALSTRSKGKAWWPQKISSSKRAADIMEAIVGELELVRTTSSTLPWRFLLKRKLERTRKQLAIQALSALSDIFFLIGFRSLYNKRPPLGGQSGPQIEWARCGQGTAQGKRVGKGRKF